MTTHALTDAQADEIDGLLAVADDEGRAWGARTGRSLTVTDPADAVDDLLWRARYLDEEGARQGSPSHALARSLRTLADRIGNPTKEPR